MSAAVEQRDGSAPPLWAAFGDLMAVSRGAFVLFLVGVIGVQLHLEIQLQEEVAQREAEQQRRQTLEQALAAPLAAGRITLADGRIGISGSLLFALNSDRLQEEGEALLDTLAGPLADYLAGRDAILMVSVFAEDRQDHACHRLYVYN